MIKQENEHLRSLGIPPPRYVSEMSYKSTPSEGGKQYVKIESPKFYLPDHRMFVINKYAKRVVTFFDNLEKVDSKYKWWGLGDAVRPELGGIWTNRDPYAFYRELGKEPKYGCICGKAGEFTAGMESARSNVHSEAQKLKPLENAEAISSEEAAKIHLRLQLFNYVNDYYFSELHSEKTYYDLERNGSHWLPEEILFNMPVPCTWFTTDYTCVKLLPLGTTKPAQMVEFFDSLRNIDHFLVFEILRDETVYFRLHFPNEHLEQIAQKLHLYFPGITVIVDEPFFLDMNYSIQWIKKPRMYNSIKRLRDLQIDPYAHFASILDNAPEDELLCYQVIFAPLTDQTTRVLKSLSQRSYPPLREEHIKAFNKKIPAWFVSVSASGESKDNVSSLMQSVSRAFNSTEQCLSKPISYSLENWYFPQRYPAFISMFDTEELAALAHLPVMELPIERLETNSQKNSEPPDMYTSGETRIGCTKARGQMFPVTLPEEVRDRHVYIVGKSGTGKSTLVETIARRDIEAGRGLAVIDPHGDLVQHLLETMPEHRATDCVFFSPKHSPVSLEILAAENENEIDLLSDDLITMFRRTSESWGDKMQAILQMAFQTLLRVPGSSFTDISRLLTDEGYRYRILTKIDHPQLTSFWQHRYDVRQAEPILIRMDRLTTSGTLRQVLTQQKNSLNFYDAIQESKIFLADLSKGFLGESTSHLLGSIIVSQIQLAAMRQAHLPAEQRIPFSLFVDEVQNFTTSAFSTILSEARKMKLRLCIAHQFVSQLPTEIQKAVFGNVGTLVFFGMSPDDLGAARHELGSFEPEDIANLPKYHALCRPATAALDTFIFTTDPPPAPPERNYAQAIIEQTRREYGAPAATMAPAEIEQPAKVIPPQTAAPPRTDTPQVDNRRPSPAKPLSFPTNAEKIMHFLRQAEYLSQPQIIALTELLPPNASTALKKLVDTGQIKSLDDRRPKIYFIGRTCNPTAHNLMVRDLLVKIYASGFAIQAIKFNEQLSDINPDLVVEFETENGAPLLTYFELDRGTEGVSELVRKAERYAQLSDKLKVCFVFEKEPDMNLARTRINNPFIHFAVLDQFTTLKDESFYSVGTDSLQLPYFGS